MMKEAPEIRVDPHLRVLLNPGSRIGAIPLLSPSTRKVAAGLLIEPRFRWVAVEAMTWVAEERGLGGA